MYRINKDSGTDFEVKLLFATCGIDVDSVDAILDFLLENPAILDEDEYVEKRSPDIPPGMMLLMVEEKYYINLKLSTLWLAAKIIGATFRLDLLGEPILESLLELGGIPKDVFAKLSELFGETCIVRETMLKKGKVGSCDILVQFKGKCCNNDLKCSFREGENCNCTPEDVLEIYEGLAEHSMFKRNGDKFEYQW